MPGYFPYFNESMPVRRGIPQNAYFDAHLKHFRKQVKEIPKNLKGSTQ